jgi:hypothetical protein
MLMKARDYSQWVATASAVLVCVGVLSACGAGNNSAVADTDPTPTGMTLARIGEYGNGTLAAAEITAFDPSSKRLFVVNGALKTIDVLNLSNPAAPVKVSTISVSAMGAGVNSVAIQNGIVAVAIEATVKTSPGTVAFYRASDLSLLSSATVGALPDMVAFTPDGKNLLVANEGEPNSYGQPDSVDPEGSISIVNVQNIATPVVRTAAFTSFNSQIASLRTAGVRIFGPGASVAQDLEPEYIAISPDGATAFVTLQENNALAIVDVASATVTKIKPLGFKDHNIAGAGLDLSDEDGAQNTNSGTPAVRIAPQPVKGMYMPDSIAHFTANGSGYLITANEGDARDYPGFAEEIRVGAHCKTFGLEPSIFTDAGNQLLDSNLGRLKITSTPNGGSDGKNASGKCTDLYSFGARSFSIWNTAGALVYDSGDQFEQRTKALSNVNFNASHDNNTLDSRSTAKGPEPEGVTVATFGTKTFAFIGLERVGGIMVYDITNPAAPVYATYINPRTGVTGDRGPEGLIVVSAANSPNGKPLLIVGNETSGSTAVYQINLTL